MSDQSRLFLNRLKHFFFRVTHTRKYLVASCKPYDIKVKFAIADGLGRDIYYKYGVYSEDYITRFLLNDFDLKKGDLVIDTGVGQRKSQHNEGGSHRNEIRQGKPAGFLQIMPAPGI